MWASCEGHADIARVLVEHGASLEAVNKVNMHAHALANTCCIKDVSVIMRMVMMMMMISNLAYVSIPQHTSAYVERETQTLILECMLGCSRASQRWRWRQKATMAGVIARC
jgi:hypothetical protein